jgi:predicted unusual protein kinase regulating ubiquinone biosynthesis (AarF/ABC1/UbiB family)
VADEGGVALTEALGAQLRRLNGAGPKVRQFLSMVQLDREPPALGALPEGAQTVAFGRVRRVIEQDLDGRVGDLFDDFEEEPFAVASLGQVHRARTSDGDEVAVKVQHAGAAEAVESDLRSLGLVDPIVKRLAPGLDAGAVLDELRERIADELDYEVEAQHQRRLERRFRGHPHVRVPHVHTDLSARRVLVTEYVEGRTDEIERLDDHERDRIGEIAFRFYLGLAWRDGTVAGDPHVDNCIVCPDGRLCLLDFGLVRDLGRDYLDGEREVMQAVAGADAQRVHDGLSRLGYLHDPQSFDPQALLDHLAGAGEWMLAPGPRRVDPDYVARTLDLGYPPRSPYFEHLRRLNMPARTLLLRRMEVQLLALLGDLGAQADWGAIAGEHHSGKPPSTVLGREDHAFHGRSQ